MGNAVSEENKHTPSCKCETCGPALERVQRGIREWIDSATEKETGMENQIKMIDGVGDKGRRYGRVLVRLEQPYGEYTGPIVIPDNAKADVQGVRTAIVLDASPRCADLKSGDRILIDQIATVGAWPKGPYPNTHFVPEHQILGLYED